MYGSLATRLRVLRAERGLTVRQVAELSGVAKETVSQIERGERHPYDRTLAKLAHAYGVPVEELLEEPAELLAGKAGAPTTGRQEIQVALGEEREEGLRPELKHDIDATFDRLVELLRAAGVGEEIIAEYDGPQRQRVLEAVAS
jgi:transcriptional regulator with XRE-family HTH domain